jgi:hypothetical protein
VRKLFVSIKGAIGALMSGYATAADLDNGLFFLCGTGPEALADDEGLGYPENLVQQLADAMGKAEQEGRGQWSLARSVVQEGYNEYRLINQLLTRNGFRPIDESSASENMRYRQAAVEERLRGQELEVITSRWWNPAGRSGDTLHGRSRSEDTFHG